MVKQQRRRIAEGREAEIFEYEGRSVLKLFHHDRDGAGVERELAAMRAVRAAGGPAPQPFGATRVDGRPGLIMERADGDDMLKLLGKKPWALLSCGRTLGEAHAALHDVVAPPQLPAQKERFRRHIEAVAADAGTPQHRALADFVLRQLDDLPHGDRVCHGDYHPGNVIVTARGPVVIDWPNATRGDPHADVARTLLMFDIATVPPGAMTVMRRFEKLGRGLLRSRYLAAYRRRRPLDDALLARWRIPVAAQRLHDGIDDERDTLLAILEAAIARG